MRVGGKVISQPALAIRTVDTTGAGDSFNAGFLHRWLQHAPIEDALHFACACGALSTRAAGGTAGQPSLDEARAFLIQCGAVP
jgi:ribokinase